MHARRYFIIINDTPFITKGLTEFSTICCTKLIFAPHSTSFKVKVS